MMNHFALSLRITFWRWAITIGLAGSLGVVAAQENTTRGVRLIRDTDNRVVGMEYFGNAGLRAAEVEKLPHLQSVSIDRTLETIASMGALRMLEVETGVLEPNELQVAVNRALSGRKPKPR